MKDFVSLRYIGEGMEGCIKGGRGREDALRIAIE